MLDAWYSPGSRLSHGPLKRPRQRAKVLLGFAPIFVAPGVPMLRCCAILFLLLSGCTTVPNVWPLVASDNTSYRTPHMRMDAIREFAAR